MIIKSFHELLIAAGAGDRLAGTPLDLLMRMKKKERYCSSRFAREFDRLRRAQGEGQSIMTHIREIRDLRGAHVVELGAGTGVMTQRLAEEAHSVHAFDRSSHMIDFAQHNLRRLGVTNCSFTRAEHSRIPLPGGSADVVLAAWALDSVAFDSGPDRWKPELDRIVLEMRRLTKSGGMIIILATPLRGERDFQGYLERAHGFQSHLFNSVWRFSSKRIAREAISFFLREKVWKSYEPHWPGDFFIPAGIWWRME
jgi:ubiquinone/menaquinone biosynthesis C-methylase UbiE